MCASVLVCDTLYMFLWKTLYVCFLLKCIFNTVPFLFLGLPTSDSPCFHYKCEFSGVYDLVIKHHIGAGSVSQEKVFGY